jgi:flagellar protein FlgJ
MFPASGVGYNAFQNTADHKKHADVATACREMESYFLYTLLKTMRGTVPESTLLPKSHAEGIFQDMLDEQIARVAANAGGVGLADALGRNIGSQNLGD